MNEFGLDGDFALLFMFKVLICSTVVGLFASMLFSLVFPVIRFKFQSIEPGLKALKTFVL